MEPLLGFVWLEGRRVLKNAGMGLIPAVVLILPGTLYSGHWAKGLLLTSIGFLTIGMFQIPLMLVGDRRSGVLDFYRQLPFSRTRMAFARIALNSASAVVGGVGCSICIAAALSVTGKAPPGAMIISATSVGVFLMIAVSTFLTPLLARLPFGFAIGAPVGILLLLSPWITKAKVIDHVQSVLFQALQSHVTMWTSVAVLVGGWAILATITATYVKVLGRALQPRGAPTERAMSVLHSHLLAGQPVKAS